MALRGKALAAWNNANTLMSQSSIPTVKGPDGKPIPMSREQYLADFIDTVTGGAGSERGVGATMPLRVSSPQAAMRKELENFLSRTTPSPPPRPVDEPNNAGGSRRMVIRDDDKPDWILDVPMEDVQAALATGATFVD